MKRKYIRGFSLIEAAIVLGIVGLVIGGIWVAASTVNVNLKASRTAEGVLTTCSNVAKLFKMATAPTSGNEIDITDVAIQAKLVPSDWIQGSTIVPPYGGRAGMSQYELGYPWDPAIDRSGQVSLYMGGMSQKMCIKIAQDLSVKSVNYIMTAQGQYDNFLNLSTDFNNWTQFLSTDTAIIWQSCPTTTINDDKIEVNCKVGS